MTLVSNLPGLMLDYAHPLSRGLVGWWPLNEGGGSRVNDISGLGNHGAFSGITQGPTSGWTGSSLGSAVRFDAVDDFVTVPHSASLNFTAEFTVSAWLVLNSTASYPTYVMKGSGGAGYPGPFHLGVESTAPTWLFATGNGASAQDLVYAVTPVLGRPTHLCGVHAGGAAPGSRNLLYVNGAYAGGVTTTQTTVNNGTALAIGGRTPGTLYGANGPCWHVRLYNRALSAVEVAQLYADPLAGALGLNAADLFLPPAAPKSADRLYNRGSSRIYRRGETPGA